MFLDETYFGKNKLLKASIKANTMGYKLVENKRIIPLFIEGLRRDV